MRHRWTRPVAVVTIAVTCALGLAPLAHAQDPPPPASKRTMPTLKVVCPAKIGVFFWENVMPDAPIQESCHYGNTFGFSLGASWGTTPREPGDSLATCQPAAKTSWQPTSDTQWERFSATHRAHVWLSLDRRDRRQYDHVPELKALADQMLAATEKVAQPCYPPGATPSPTPSAEPEPTPDDSPTATPTPSPSGEPICPALAGRLTDAVGDPVDGVVVRLLLSGETSARETGTDEEGRFQFDELTAPEEGPATGELSVYGRAADRSWVMFAAEKLVKLETTPIGLAPGDGCQRDISTRDMTDFAYAHPASAEEWTDVWATARKTQRALAFIRDDLDVRLRRGPVEIYGWCTVALHKLCAKSGSAFATDRARRKADGDGNDFRIPYYALGTAETSTQSEQPQDDTVYHELGHVLLADLFGSADEMTHDQSTNHAGYANASSNDSWVEGFASWFATEIRLADGRESAYYWFGDRTTGSPKKLEPNVKAWDSGRQVEEWAVAGLLGDLTDGPGGAGEEVESVVERVGGQSPAAFIRGQATAGELIVVELYDAAGKLVETDEALVLDDGRFLDVSTTEFATARVTRRPAGTQEHDDDQFDATPRRVIELIRNVEDIGDRGSRSFGATVVFDVAELYDVLRKTTKGRDANANGTDDLAELFVAHGFHENLQRPLNTYHRGARIGVTTHAPHDRSNPRYAADIAPELYVKVDTGAVPATMAVFPSGGRPYLVAPNADGRIPVHVPSAGTKGRALVVTLADGYRPHVSVIESAPFWKQAAKHDEPFLTLAAPLEREATGGGGTGPAPRDGGRVVAAGTAGDLRRLQFPIAAGVTMLFVGVAAVVMRRRQRRRALGG